MVRGQRVCWFHLCPMNEAGPLVLSELEVPAAFQLCGASGRIYGSTGNQLGPEVVPLHRQVFWMIHCFYDTPEACPFKFWGVKLWLHDLLPSVKSVFMISTIVLSICYVLCAHVSTGSFTRFQIASGDRE
jgi:hypothetical protein